MRAPDNKNNFIDTDNGTLDDSARSSPAPSCRGHREWLTLSLFTVRCCFRRLRLARGWTRGIRPWSLAGCLNISLWSPICVLACPHGKWKVSFKGFWIWIYRQHVAYWYTLNNPSIDKGCSTCSRIWFKGAHTERLLKFVTWPRALRPEAFFPSLTPPRPSPTRPDSTRINQSSLSKSIWLQANRSIKEAYGSSLVIIVLRNQSWKHEWVRCRPDDKAWPWNRQLSLN